MTEVHHFFKSKKLEEDIDFRQYAGMSVIINQGVVVKDHRDKQVLEEFSRHTGGLVLTIEDQSKGTSFSDGVFPIVETSHGPITTPQDETVESLDIYG